MSFFIGNCYSRHRYAYDGVPPEGWCSLLDKYYHGTSCIFSVGGIDTTDKLSYDNIRQFAVDGKQIVITFDSYVCTELAKVLQTNYQSEIKKIHDKLIPLDPNEEKKRFETFTPELQKCIENSAIKNPKCAENKQFYVLFQIWYNAIHRWDPGVCNTFSCHSTPTIPKEYMTHFIAELSTMMNDNNTERSLTGVTKMPLSDTEDVWFIVFDGYPITIFKDHMFAWSPSVDFDDGCTISFDQIRGNKILTMEQIEPLNRQFKVWYEELLKTNYANWDSAIFSI